MMIPIQSATNMRLKAIQTVNSEYCMLFTFLVMFEVIFKRHAYLPNFFQPYTVIIHSKRQKH